MKRTMQSSSKLQRKMFRVASKGTSYGGNKSYSGEHSSETLFYYYFFLII